MPSASTSVSAGGRRAADPGRKERGRREREQEFEGAAGTAHEAERVRPLRAWNACMAGVDGLLEAEGDSMSMYARSRPTVP